jgi:hypothetical protein
MRYLIFTLILLLASPVFAGDTTTNSYFYLPSLGASGASERTTWFNTLETTDGIIKTNTDKVTNATHTGDVTGATALTIANDAVEEPMLKAVDAANDEECLTYEATVGDFEWQTCGGAETNSLETTITGIADTEVFVGDGADSGAFVVVSGDATLANTGALTVADDSHNHVITNIDSFTKANLETQTSDVADYAEADGDIFTGTHDFGGADDLEVPNSATPTVDTAGQVAIDTTITDYTGLIKYHDGTEELTVVAMPTANLSTTDTYVVSYSAANDEFTMSAVSGGSPTVGVRAYMGGGASNTVQSSATTTQIDTESWDIGGDFNTGTYTFTAPADGKYLVTHRFSCTADDNTNLDIYFKVNAALVRYGPMIQSAASDNDAYETNIMTSALDLSQNDTLVVQHAASGASGTTIARGTEYTELIVTISP